MIGHEGWEKNWKFELEIEGVVEPLKTCPLNTHTHTHTSTPNISGETMTDLGLREDKCPHW